MQVFFIFFQNFYLQYLKKNIRSKYFTFKKIYIIFYCVLLVFSFTYYGNHGLGDEANIPLGHWKTMNSGDGHAYFETDLAEGQINVDRFLVKNENLYIASRDKFFIYQLQSDEIKKFDSEEHYNDYALAHNLPAANKLQNFWNQYSAYWDGWRFWLLP